MEKDTSLSGGRQFVCDLGTLCGPAAYAFLKLAFYFHPLVFVALFALVFFSMSF